MSGASMYAHVTNGTVDQDGDLPSTWVNKDGSTTSGFPFLTDEEHAAEDWFPLVDVIPDYNTDTQQLDTFTYTFSDTQVTRTWTVVDKPPPPPPPPPLTTAEKLASVDLTVDELKTALGIS